MTETVETLTALIARSGGVEMTEAELHDVLPIVAEQLELLETVRGLEVTEQMAAPRSTEGTRR